MRARIALTALILGASLHEIAEGRQGSWSAPYDHPVSNGPATWPLTVVKFEAINMAVIPIVGTGSSTNPGKVIVWDQESTNSSIPAGQPWPQRYSVGAPEVPTSWANYILMVPAGLGDLFCAGQTWLPDGRLFVAGGNTKYPDLSTPTTADDNYLGSKAAGIWDPSNNSWTMLPVMQRKRWYPTVTLLGNNQVMVSGGVEDTFNNVCYDPNGFVPDGAADTYEVWDIGAGWLTTSGPGTVAPGVFEGPAYPQQYANVGPCFSLFAEYPRQHLLSSGQLFVSGMWRGANRMHPTAHGVWLTNYPNWVSQSNPGSYVDNILDTMEFRYYGSSVLVPNIGNAAANIDRVMILGGSLGAGQTPPSSFTSIVQICDAYNGIGASSSWSPYATSTVDPSAFPSLKTARMLANTVLLPDGGILVVGGCTGLDYFDQDEANRKPPYPPVTYESRPELYRGSVNDWTYQSPQSSQRMYHSTAALLPSAKVVSAGSDRRDFDYEVFSPDYLLTAPASFRPAFVGTVGPYLSFDATYQLTYAPGPPGVHVDRVVLMRPCSVTHHSDMDHAMSSSPR